MFILFENSTLTKNVFISPFEYTTTCRHFLFHKTRQWKSLRTHTKMHLKLNIVHDSHQNSVAIISTLTFSPYKNGKKKSEKRSLWRTWVWQIRKQAITEMHEFGVFFFCPIPFRRSLSSAIRAKQDHENYWRLLLAFGIWKFFTYFSFSFANKFPLFKYIVGGSSYVCPSVKNFSNYFKIKTPNRFERPVSNFTFTPLDIRHLFRTK